MNPALQIGSWTLPMSLHTIHHEGAKSAKGRLVFSLVLFVASVAFVVKNQVHGHNASQVMCNDDFP